LFEKQEEEEEILILQQSPYHNTTQDKTVGLDCGQFGFLDTIPSNRSSHGSEGKGKQYSC
jgi:hypothetical protein